MSQNIHKICDLPRENFQYVAEGRDRVVFSLSGFPWVLVKVLGADQERVQRVLDQEMRFWKSRQDDSVPVARVFGQCRTVLGEAQVTEAVRDENGQVAPNLFERLQQGTFTQEHLEALNVLVDEAIEHHVTLSDYSLRNLVFGRRRADTASRVYIVDGFGDKSFIQLKNWARWANTAHILRKFSRVPKGYGLVWDGDARQYQFHAE